MCTPWSSYFEIQLKLQTLFSDPLTGCFMGAIRIARALASSSVSAFAFKRLAFISKIEL